MKKKNIKLSLFFSSSSGHEADGMVEAKLWDRIYLLYVYNTHKPQCAHI
jgi:hypothetical protein